MKIAVIGSGGREHAISWKLAQSIGWDNVLTLPGNGGTPNCYAVDVCDFEAIKSFCEAQQISMIFVGPEAPLTEGIVNFFEGSGIDVFGPDKAGAQLEGSKIYSKNFMNKYGVATADFKAFERVSDAAAYVEEKKGNLVIKYDGLAAGKGVFVCDNVQEATAALAELAEKYGEECPFLIEDKIVGDEISIIGITDGKSMKLLRPSQDHKQLNDGDTGPNTGGMGAFCPVPFCDDRLMQQIWERAVSPTLKGIQAEGYNYKGIVYFGLMIDENGPKLLEYNARLGDPETEVLMPSLKSDLVKLLQACFDGTLADFEMEFNEGYWVDVVQVSGGYPKAYQKGYPITGLDQIGEDSLIFHAGTKREAEHILTNGGRVINIVCNGATLDEAIEKAYTECAKINFQDNYYRKDIGQRKSSLIKS